MVDRQAIDMQIRSMDLPKSTFSRQLSTIHSWLAQTQTELITSVEEDAWAVHVGATHEGHNPQALSQPVFQPNSDFLVGDRVDKTRKLHVSGAFYVDIDSDGSDDDSFKSANSQPQRNIDRPYNIVEDSSSDESRSLRSDSDDETRSAARDARDILTAISEEEEDEVLCSAPQSSSSNLLTVPETKTRGSQLANSVRLSKRTGPTKVLRSKSSAVDGHPHDVSANTPLPKHSDRSDSLSPGKTNDSGDPQDTTSPTLASSSGPAEAPSDRRTPRNGSHAPPIVSSLPESSTENMTSPNTNGTGPETTTARNQVPSKAVKISDDPRGDVQQRYNSRSAPKELQHDRRAAKPRHLPQAPTPMERPHSNEEFEDRSKPSSLTASSDYHERLQHDRRAAKSKRLPRAPTPIERPHLDEESEDLVEPSSRAASSGCYERTVSPHKLQKQTIPLPVRATEDQATESAQAVTDADVPIFDPLGFIEQTFQDVRDTPSQATSLMSSASRKRLGGLFGRWNRANERHNKHLEYFCEKGKASAVKELLRRGSDPGTRDKSRPQPIVLATKGATLRHNKCVKALIEWDCDVNCRLRGKTPIHYALENLYFDGYLPLLRMLLEAGAELSQPDSTKEYPLTKLFSGPRDSPLEDYQISALALILHPSYSESTVIDVNVYQRASLDTALHLAVQRRTPYAVALLLHRGAKINAKNASGTTPLLMAANQWKPSLTVEQRYILSILLDHGNLEINAVGGSFNRTALHQAAKVGCVDAVQMLIDGGADVRLEDKNGESALSLCEAFVGDGKPELVEQFTHTRDLLRDRENS